MNKIFIFLCMFLVNTQCCAMKNIFNKIGNTAKSAVANVTHTGAKVTGKISERLDKVSHKMGVKDHACEGGSVPEVPKTDNTSPEIPGSSQEKPTDPSKTVLPQKITDTISQFR